MHRYAFVAAAFAATAFGQESSSSQTSLLSSVATSATISTSTTDVSYHKRDWWNGPWWHQSTQSMSTSTSTLRSATSGSIHSHTSKTFSTIPTTAPVTTAATTPVTTTKKGPPPPPGPTATRYIQAVVQHHNYHRANHSAPNIKWSPKMASFARGIANSCNYAHNINFGGGGYGQNIAAGAPANDISGVITDLFYNNEVNLYKGMYGENNPDMTNFEGWGHFSQVVWKDTTEVGCYTIDCSKRKGGLKGITGVYANIAPFFTVCNYSPPGNYAGEYTNVGKPLNHKTIQGTYRVNEKNIKSPNPPPANFYTGKKVVAPKKKVPAPKKKAPAPKKKANKKKHKKVAGKL